MKYRKKPIVVEAIQYTGENDGRDIETILAEAACLTYSANGFPAVLTREGCMEISIGDWLIRGVKGEYYPCKPDIFEATYEPLGEDV